MPSAAVISEQPLHAARRMLERGRANLPIVVATAPIAADDPDALFFYAKTDEAGFHRLWAAALFHRALDGYDATLQLWESALDTEARAHCRIAFEHLLSFAWVLADDGDITRSLRIAPSRSHAPRLVEVVAEQLRSALLIAASNAAWLIGDVA